MSNLTSQRIGVEDMIGVWVPTLNWANERHGAESLHRGNEDGVAHIYKDFAVVSLLIQDGWMVRRERYAIDDVL